MWLPALVKMTLTRGWIQAISTEHYERVQVLVAAKFARKSGRPANRFLLARLDVVNIIKMQDRQATLFCFCECHFFWFRGLKLSNCCRCRKLGLGYHMVEFIMSGADCDVFARGRIDHVRYGSSIRVTSVRLSTWATAHLGTGHHPLLTRAKCPGNPQTIANRRHTFPSGAHVVTNFPLALLRVTITTSRNASTLLTMVLQQSFDQRWAPSGPCLHA